MSQARNSQNLKKKTTRVTSDRTPRVGGARAIATRSSRTYFDGESAGGVIDRIATPRKVLPLNHARTKEKYLLRARVHRYRMRRIFGKGTLNFFK